MEGKYAFEYILKRNELIETSPKRESVKFSGSDINTIDSYLLFQRLVVLAKVSNISFDNCEGHEVYLYPPAV